MQAKFQNLTLKNGLSSNKVYSSFKDSKGFVWFATDNGLCRYDGIHFKIFNKLTFEQYGLTDNVFHHVYQKSDDEILAFSLEGNLFKYNYSTGRFYNIKEQNPLLKNYSLRNIYRDRQNYYWFCTNNGLIKTDSHFSFIKEYIIPYDNQYPKNYYEVITICEDRRGIFWLGTEGRAAIRFDPLTGIFSQKELFNIMPAFQRVDSIINDSDSNYVYIASGGEGLFRVNIFNFTFKRWKFRNRNSNSLPSDRITNLSLREDTLLWIGTLDGLAKMNLRTQKITRFTHDPLNQYSLINNIVYHLNYDSQNILWISTFGGVSSYNKTAERFDKVSQNYPYKNTLSSDKICHVLNDRFGNLWIGTSKGIDVQGAQNGKYFHYDLPKSFPGHKNEEIEKFFVDDDNTWWVGTWGGGLSRFTIPANFRPGDKLIFKNFYNNPSDGKSISSNFIRSLAKDKKGNIWITTWNGGLNKIDSADKNKDYIPFQRFLSGNDNTKFVASNFIDAICVDDEQKIWLGTSMGLQRAEIEIGKFEMYFADPKNPHDLINTNVSILQDEEKNIWLGNYGGLVKFSQNNNSTYSAKIIYKEVFRGIYALTIDKKGILWFSTLNSEIGSYNTKSGKLKFYSMIEEIDGFDFYLGDPCVDKEGKIYFVGNSGYLFFNPDNLMENNFVPPVYITNISIEGKEYICRCDVSQLNEIILNYDQGNLVIDFAALNYIYPNKNEYKYILEDFEKNWISLGNKTEITFANLPSGHYKLKIIGSNNDNVWNYAGASLDIIVMPPFWQNNYFRIIAVTLLVAGVYMFFNSKINRLKKEKQQQHNFSKLLIESQEEERKRLSQELHDSLGQNLLVIKNQLDMYQSAEKKNEEEITRVSDLIKESITEVKEVSANLHPHQLTRLGLIKAIKSMVNKLSLSSNIEFEIQLDEISGLLPKEREIDVFRIVQESLNNVIKHSETKKASVIIKKQEQKILILIEDSGKGFNISDKKMQNKFDVGFGLKSIAERVRLLNGDLQIKSTPGKGTKICVIITLA